MPRTTSPKAGKPAKEKIKLNPQQIVDKTRNPRTRDSLTREELRYALICIADDMIGLRSRLHHIEQLRDSERNRAKEYFLAGARAARNRDLQIISIFSQATREYADPGQALHRLVGFAALPEQAGDTAQVR